MGQNEPVAETERCFVSAGFLLVMHQVRHPYAKKPNPNPNANLKETDTDPNLVHTILKTAGTADPTKPVLHHRSVQDDGHSSPTLTLNAGGIFDAAKNHHQRRKLRKSVPTPQGKKMGALENIISSNRARLSTKPGNRVRKKIPCPSRLTRSTSAYPPIRGNGLACPWWFLAVGCRALRWP